jgi:hypothetical protein
VPKLQESLLTEAVAKRFQSFPVGAKPSREYSNYIIAICRAIAAAHEHWRQAASLTGLQINGVTATGGRFTGPSLADVINTRGPLQGLSGLAMPYTRAIGDGLAACWNEWQQSVRVPGLAWYPSFAAVPSPYAPPVANVPTALSKLTWSPLALTPDHLKLNIKRRLARPGPASEELFTSVATGFSKAAALWMAMQIVTGVVGRGPVPTFSPPYVPVGPVVGGDNIGAPAHLLA